MLFKKYSANSRTHNAVPVPKTKYVKIRSGGKEIVVVTYGNLRILSLATASLRLIRLKAEWIHADEVN